MDKEIDQALNNIVTDDIELNTPIVKIIVPKDSESFEDKLEDLAPTLPDF